MAGAVCVMEGLECPSRAIWNTVYCLGEYYDTPAGVYRTLWEAERLKQWNKSGSLWLSFFLCSFAIICKWFDAMAYPPPATPPPITGHLGMRQGLLSQSFVERMKFCGGPSRRPWQGNGWGNGREGIDLRAEVRWQLLPLGLLFCLFVCLFFALFLMGILSSIDN